MSTEIPYSRQDIDERDIAAVTAVLRSDFLTQGPQINRFEQAISAHCFAKHAIVLSSGSAALHCCYAALGIQAGDRVWTSPISFVATANAALHLGAKVDFVDIDPATGNMSLEALKEKLDQAKATATLPKLVVPVHFTGRCVELEPFRRLSKQFGFFIVEDAAHAFGASDSSGNKVGSCRYSDATVFSFHPVKSITTGEGGAVTTNNPELATRIQLFRSHGITRNQPDFLNPSPGPWYYEQHALGFNYRLTDIQAALGLSQMNRLDYFIQQRRKVADFYTRALSHTSLLLPPLSEVSAWHLYVIRFPHQEIEFRTKAFHYLRERNIGTNVHYIPIHLQPYYKGIGFKEGDFPVAESFFQRALSIPIYSSLSKEDQQRVVQNLLEFISI